jgi:poly(glycerol-phosphate) alpha-glucosyltransferase
LAQRLHSHEDLSVEAFGTRDKHFQVDSALWSPVQTHAFSFYGPRQFRWSPPLARAFGRCRADVAHLHALWMHTSIIIERWARRRQRPYLISLHGMLEPWAVRHGQWRKRLSNLLYERRCLRRAACIHVGTENEFASARAFGLENPICIIPNGVLIPNGMQPVARQPLRSSQLDWAAAKKTLLYLGRLHPKKGLMNLLESWSSLRRESASSTDDWSLVIAGWDQGGHEQQLKKRAAELAIDRQVSFPGPLFGDDKAAALSAAHAIVLPSFSEGLPMAVLEAWSYGKPVLLTPGCNLSEGVAAGAALEARPDEASLTKGLADLISASDEQRATMGRQGLALVQRKFAWGAVADQMCAVYRWVTGGGSSPACVIQS